MTATVASSSVRPSCTLAMMRTARSRLLDRAVVEIRRGLRDVAQHRHAEDVAVFFFLGDGEAADVDLVRAGFQPVVLHQAERCIIVPPSSGPLWQPAQPFAMKARRPAFCARAQRGVVAAEEAVEGRGRRQRRLVGGERPRRSCAMLSGSASCGYAVRNAAR